MTDTDLLFPITLTLQAAFSSLVLFAVIGVPLALYTARSKTRLSRAVLFLATLPLIFPPVALGYLLLLLLGINGAGDKGVYTVPRGIQTGEEWRSRCFLPWQQRRTVALIERAYYL